MLIEIVTPDQQIFSGDIASAVFPGSNGSFGILENHAPMVATLQYGNIELTENSGNTHSFEVNGGVVEINHNKIIVLAD